MAEVNYYKIGNATCTTIASKGDFMDPLNNYAAYGGGATYGLISGAYNGTNFASSFIAAMPNWNADEVDSARNNGYNVINFNLVTSRCAGLVLSESVFKSLDNVQQITLPRSDTPWTVKNYTFYVFFSMMKIGYAYQYMSPLFWVVSYDGNRYVAFPISQDNSNQYLDLSSYTLLRTNITHAGVFWIGEDNINLGYPTIIPPKGTAFFYWNSYRFPQLVEKCSVIGQGITVFNPNSAFYVQDVNGLRLTLNTEDVIGDSFTDSNNEGVLKDPPYEGGGNSSTGGGNGSFDDTSEPIEFTPLPSTSVITSGFVGLYNPTVSQLQKLANYLWNDTLLDLDQLRKLVANPIDLLISLTIVPVKPQVTGAETIKVGWRDTGVAMNKISQQFMQFNFGSIDISEYFGSALDYAPFTKISIYLPYIGLKQLNVDEIMNNTIELQYNIDLFTGACVAEIKVGNAVLYSFNGNIANQIPITAESFDSFLRAVIGAVAAVGVTVASGGAGSAVAAGSMAGEAGATATGLSAAGAASIGTTSANAVLSSKPDIQHAGSMASNTGYMANKRPYILIEYPRMSVPKNYQNYSGYPCNVTFNLGELSGYTAISDIHLDGIPATDTELDELETILKGGIII